MGPKQPSNPSPRPRVSTNQCLLPHNTVYYCCNLVRLTTRRPHWKTSGYCCSLTYSKLSSMPYPTSIDIPPSSLSLIPIPNLARYSAHALKLSDANTSIACFIFLDWCLHFRTATKDTNPNPTWVESKSSHTLSLLHNQCTHKLSL